VFFGLNRHVKLFFSNIRIFGRDIDIFVKISPAVKTGEALRQTNSGTILKLRPANSRESTQVTPEAREGKPRAKTGRN
jgi:hypothetical protein